MLLTGRVQNDNYTNKNGERVYSVQIIAEEIEFAERKSTADANASRGGSNNFGGGAPEPAMAADDDFMNIPDGIEDGLPFN
jgi:single-strand DNA-binding protein